MIQVTCYSVFATTKAPFFLPRSVPVHSQKPHPAVQQTDRWHPRVSRHHKHQLRQGATCAYSGSNAATTLIKICGVTSAEDAELAAAAGAHFIGMIMWPKAKRAVAPAVALAIAAVARRHGAQAVGVFVDEDARTIAERCREAGIGVAQLHGDAAREAVARLPESVQVIYVMHADSDGVIQTMQPAQLAASLGQDLSRPVDWVLVDGLVGGSGERFDWKNLQAPKEVAQRGWFLAGGLDPHNVAEAVQQLHPTGVDVSSGVTGPDKLKKDATKVCAFVSAVQELKTAPQTA